MIAVSGLAALSGLHAVWATGSSWPAKNAEQLAEAVVGQAIEMPATAPTAVVSAGAAVASLLASGALGDGSVQRLGVRVIGTAMLLRAALGGNVALAALKLPPSGEKFRTLDRRFYRPFAALIGVSLWLAATR